MTPPAEEKDKITAFEIYRPLYEQQIKDLQEAVKKMSEATTEQDKQIALMQQKIALYSTGAAIAAAAIVKYGPAILVAAAGG